ncbi:PTS transporter subunit EIIC [Enterococcus saccharolyticus]|uniref:Permease IIC component n=1 Tax=Candidatus Enterococcus willemsii TaxID=1857215 RepID=A0ABQ6YXF9_9ENTE|nr:MULTISPECIES: PTS transporter subunit EIIC [Enterococcus]KAF1302159.1 PTS cellobiose transporter subunit IIC [Enterococcus sp. CU12B]MCD5001860.1 PTS transporter subunit EIIC [Enterococcus saccharolyticus]
MNAVFQFLETKLMPPLNKVANLRFIRAIMQAGVITVPFTIVGSIFLIINNLPQIIPPLAPFFEATILKFSPLYSVVTTMSIGSIALFYCLATAYYLTDSYRQDDAKLSSFVGAILGLFAFLMTIVQVDISNGSAQLIQQTSETGMIYNGISLGGWVTRFGGIGIFIGIITAVIATQIYRFCSLKNITITMPNGVPDGVSKAFASLIPAIFIAVFMVIVNAILAIFHTDLHGILSKPFEFVKDLTGSWLGIVVIMLLIHLLWAVGVHGTSIIKNSFINPILLVALTENIDGASNIFAGDFVNMYIFIGGAGSTLGLVLLMVFVAKSEQLKVLGRAAILPGLFNINEPVIFGAPIVYNPYLIIPFIITPIINVTISYFATSMDLVNKVITGIPWISPVGIGAFLGTGGDFRAIIIAFINLFVSIAIYYPFFKMYDGKLYAEQTGNN